MEDQKELTELKFWENYWVKRLPEIVQIVPTNDPLNKEIDSMVQGSDIKSAAELGGFPGTYCIYLTQKHNIPTTVVDYFISEEIMNKVLVKNNMSSGDIGTIQFDLLDDKPVDKTFDFIFSFGLIEHFDLPKNIIKRHVDFLNKDGQLLITIPNFRGINGASQKKYNPDNYKAHNIDCMDPQVLREWAKELGLKEIRAEYFGGFTMWLENYESLNVLGKLKFKCKWLVGKLVYKLLKVKNEKYSPYIYLKAIK
jgi:SAM-dependent methyltransferase